MLVLKGSKRKNEEKKKQEEKIESGWEFHSNHHDKQRDDVLLLPNVDPYELSVFTWSTLDPIVKLVVYFKKT